MNINPIYQTGNELRQAIRRGTFNGQTAGQAPSHLQGNVVILPRALAGDFLVYCKNNPKPCPLIGVSKPGETALPALGEIDIRTDIPKYRIFREGTFAEEAGNINSIWSDDLVTFVLGCSFTFEEALIESGYKVRHVENGSNVPMFRTNIQTIPSFGFSGPMVVTMRSYPADQISAVYDISSRFDHAHGSPLYWGDPSAIGIKDLSKPDYGDPVEVPDNEIPVFWACGVTPQAALAQAKPTLSITHAPGCMLVTDVASEIAPHVGVSLGNISSKEPEKHKTKIAAAQ